MVRAYLGARFAFDSLELTTTELLAADRDIEGIRQFLEVDSIGYVSIDGLLSCVSGPRENYCTACWSGEYCVPIDRHLGRFKSKRKR